MVIGATSTKSADRGIKSAKPMKAASMYAKMGRKGNFSLLIEGRGCTCPTLKTKLPKYEMYETGSQLRRASKSISANIVEGYGRRRYKAEYIRYLIFAHSSNNEAIEWLEYIRDCHPAHKDISTDYLVGMDKLGRKLNRFIQAVEKEHLI